MLIAKLHLEFSCVQCARNMNTLLNITFRLCVPLARLRVVGRSSLYSCPRLRRLLAGSSWRQRTSSWRQLVLTSALWPLTLQVVESLQSLTPPTSSTQCCLVNYYFSITLPHYNIMYIQHDRIKNFRNMCEFHAQCAFHNTGWLAFLFAKGVACI